ncbi:hypothetical protein BC830DRAFT_1140060 [Chytriomyces sp. MP71]|nr:hypothetical protein BC830DRAFT_1140060 [Chytriomyces sp. MP71]
MSSHHITPSLDTGLRLSNRSSQQSSSSSRKSKQRSGKKPLVITKHPSENRTHLAPLSSIPAEAQSDPVQYSIATIKSIFSNTLVHPDRLIYALAGTLFKPESPFPFGGPRLSPGYTKFSGRTGQSLLHFIVAGADECYNKYRDPQAMELVSNSIGRLMSMHYQGMKDALDERVLKGMKKAGHIEWFGAANLPQELQHVDEIRGRNATAVVDFCLRNR